MDRFGLEQNPMERDDKTADIFRDEEFSFGMEKESRPAGNPTPAPAEEPQGNSGDAPSSKLPKSPKPPKDEFLGGAVVFFIGFSLLLGTGFFAYLGYRILQTTQDDRASIETLGTETREEPVATVSEETVAEPPPPEEVATEPVEEKEALDKATIEVVVLNGGAPGGTAGAVTKLLVDAGFSKAEAGNAEGEYAETTIFFQEGSEEAAKAVGDALSGAYEDVSVEQADSSNDDMTARVTVVVTR